LMAFHSLLHQCLYATTRLMSKLMSRPYTKLQMLYIATLCISHH